MVIKLILFIDVINVKRHMEDLASQVSKEYSGLIKSIGSHIPKLNGSITESLVSWVNNQSLSPSVPPCQIFLCNPRTGKGECQNYDILAACQLVEKYQIPLFVHAPYIINLSRPWVRGDPKTENWVMGLLRRNIEIATSISGRGVVVHVGKEVGQGEQVAEHRMQQSIRNILEFVDEKCPLLLETGAGEGTEICSLFEDLSEFYLQFTAEERKKLKICVDTCHVFAVGYDPLEFIDGWVNIHGVESIVLVHFNDSAKCRGSRVDRHALYSNGQGHIGAKRMLEVALQCQHYGKPMVVE